MRRWFDLLLLAAFAGLAAAVPLPGQGAAGQSPVLLKLDLDPGAPGIQSTRQVAPSTTFDIDVVAEGIPEGRPVGAFQFFLVYDDALILASEVPDDGTAVNDNPDANEDALGRQGLDCSVLGTAFPKGDVDEASGPGHGMAFIGCLNLTGPFRATGSVTLATVRFNVVGSSGESDLQLERAVVGDSEGGELGTCAPVIYFDAGCEPGLITVGEGAMSPAGEPSPAATEETPSAQSTPAPEATPAAEATEVPPSSSSGDSGGPWPWPGLGWVLAGLAAAGAVAGVVLYVRVRPLGGR